MGGHFNFSSIRQGPPADFRIPWDFIKIVFRRGLDHWGSPPALRMAFGVASLPQKRSILGWSRSRSAEGLEGLFGHFATGTAETANGKAWL